MTVNPVTGLITWNTTSTSPATVAVAPLRLRPAAAASRSSSSRSRSPAAAIPPVIGAAACAGLRPGGPAAGASRHRHRPRRPPAGLLGRQPARRRLVRPDHPHPALGAGLRPGGHVQRRDLLRQRRREHGQHQRRAVDRARPAAAACSPRRPTRRCARATTCASRSRGATPTAGRSPTPAPTCPRTPRSTPTPASSTGRSATTRPAPSTSRSPQPARAASRPRRRHLHRPARPRRAGLHAAPELAGRRGAADLVRRVGRRPAQPDLRAADAAARRLALALPDHPADRHLYRQRAAAGRDVRPRHRAL